LFNNKAFFGKCNCFLSTEILLHTQSLYDKLVYALFKCKNPEIIMQNDPGSE